MSETRKFPKVNVLKSVIGDYIQPPFVTQEIFDSAISYQPEKSDLFVATYPKNGTTWMLYIAHMLYGRSLDLSKGDNIFDKYAALDFIGAEKTKEFPIKPRIIKTHYYYAFTPKSDEAKYIYVARNPKDTVVSFYHHTVGFPFYEFENGNFDDYFQLFLEGKVDFNNYFDMVPEWWERSKEKDNIHFVLYEDLKTNFEEEILKIAEFLGNGLKEKLLKDDKKMLKEITVKADIKTVKKEETLKVSHPEFKRLEHLPFARKGIIGDWKNTLNEEQSKILDEKMKEAGTKYPGFDQLWDKYKEYL